jgi:dsRNA-specific ribonuclease
MAAKVSGQILREAWIGDAVLALYVRQRVLTEFGSIDGPRAARMTSNQFLSTRGEPSHVEAEIGRVYESDGLDAAFAWIDTYLMPLFERQETKRQAGARRNSQS